MIRNDEADLQKFATAKAKHQSIPSVSGGLSLVGRQYYTVGDMLETILTDDGEIKINLAMISTSTTFEPPHAPGQVSSDTTSISLGMI